MARRIPNCAHCGKPLKDADHVLRQFPHVAGKPEVGWHTPACYDEDELSYEFPAKNAIALVRQLQQIESRGPGRLVANKDWERSKAAKI